MQLRVTETGLRLAALRFRSMATNARVLTPIAWKLRARWHESEQRRFDERPWTPRHGSTLRRYRWPISGRLGVAAARGTGSFTGVMQEALTQPHQVGIKDDVTVGRGSLTLVVGFKAQGPVSHGNWFEKGGGDRSARQVIVWDQKAQDDATNDIQGHVTGGAA